MHEKLQKQIRNLNSIWKLVKFFVGKSARINEENAKLKTKK